jgi:two-component system, NtrC family, response regulator AtoC
MKELERRIGSIARSRLPVLIEGASGTGKEALAELLHNISGIGTGFTRILCRKTGPVVYPASSMVSREADLGEIYPAARGTVFLKNIHLLAPLEQEQLLAALEQVADYGDGKDEAAAPRLLSSATEPLDPLVNRGELNPGLYHRLSVYRIWLPPLRERREDIPELFGHMVRRAANGGAPSPPTPRMLDVLTAYDWPGNLRELQNIARTYVVSSQAEEIIEELNNRSRLTPLAMQAERDGRPLKEQVKGASQKLETEIILRTLERHHWNRRRAALSLQISYRSLLYKMKSCNLRVQRQTASEGK